MRRRKWPGIADHRPKPDRRDYGKPEQVRRIRALARRLPARDLATLRGWFMEWGDWARAECRRERAWAAFEAFAAMGTSGVRIMRSLSCVMCPGPQPGEGLRLTSIYRGRKHVGLWTQNDRLGRVWIPWHACDDYELYQPNPREAQAAENAARGRRFGSAINGMMGEATRGRRE